MMFILKSTPYHTPLKYDVIEDEYPKLQLAFKGKMGEGPLW